MATVTSVTYRTPTVNSFGGITSGVLTPPFILLRLHTLCRTLPHKVGQRVQL